MEIIDANTVFGVWPKDERDISIEHLLRVMKENNISRALSVSMKGVLYDYEEGNVETLKVSQENPQIIPLATCDLRKYYGKKEIAGQLKEQGFKAMRLFPDLQGWPLDYAPFYWLLRDLDDAGLPLTISVSGRGSITKLMELAADVKIPIILSGVGYWNLSEALTSLKARENLYVETSLLDAPDSIEIITREVGAERLVFGSNSTFNYFRVSYNCLEKADISEVERGLIAGGNVRRILSL